MWWRKKHDLGCWGEEQAKIYLKQKGYKILAEHWTSRIGEIDLVAFKGGSYIFVEVKARRSQKFGRPEDAVAWWKQDKLRKTSELFLLKHKLRDVPWQIDVIAIMQDQLTGAVDIKHIENAVGG